MTSPAGWLTDPEAEELRRLAAGQVVLELGAWKGRSTVALAATARYVISVDRHHGIPGHDPDSLPDYLAAVRGLPNVAIVVADFASFVPHLRGIDLVYIDGDHTSDSVRCDTALACATGARVLAFHDWDFASVREGAGMFTVPASLVGSVASFLVAV